MAIVYVLQDFDNSAKDSIIAICTTQELAEAAKIEYGLESTIVPYLLQEPY